MCQHFTVKVVSIQADNKRQSSMKTKLLFFIQFLGGRAATSLFSRYIIVPFNRFDIHFLVDWKFFSVTHK